MEEIKASRKRKYVEALRRRAEFLRVEVQRALNGHKSMSGMQHDQHELAALDWALETILKTMRGGDAGHHEAGP